MKEDEGEKMRTRKEVRIDGMSRDVKRREERIDETSRDVESGGRVREREEFFVFEVLLKISVCTVNA